jgi:hypothetical protein
VLEDKDFLTCHSSKTYSKFSKQRLSPDSNKSPRLHDINRVLKTAKKYLFATKKFRCVTITKKRKAITFAYNEHSQLYVGQSIKIYFLEGSEYIVLSIFKVNGFYFESSIDLCAEESSKTLTVNGRGYIQLGLSVTLSSIYHAQTFSGTF